MYKSSSTVWVAAAGFLGLMLTACGGGKGSPPASEPPLVTADLGVPAADLTPPDPYSWGEATPGVTVGPFGDLKLFRDGCGAALYARFIPREDFDLLATITNAPDGTRRQVGYFQIPHFLDQARSVQRIGTGGFPAGVYSSDYSVRLAAGNKLTHSFTATPENKMYRWPGILTYVSERMVGSDLYITVRSALNGTIASCDLFDDSDCPVDGIGYSTATPNVFIKGQDSEIHCATRARAGTHYLVVIQGLDKDRNYPFYATLDRP